MFTVKLTRNENIGDEVILISPYGFEWYIDGERAREGLVEDFDEALELLKNEGFEEVA